MNSYFISQGSKFRGRPLTTLPVVLNKDLTHVSDDKLQLTSLKDLEHLRSVAQNRQTWRKLTTRIREAAEASPSDDWDAEGPKSVSQSKIWFIWEQGKTYDIAQCSCENWDVASHCACPSVHLCQGPNSM